MHVVDLFTWVTINYRLLPQFTSKPPPPPLPNLTHTPHTHTTEREREQLLVTLTHKLLSQYMLPVVLKVSATPDASSITKYGST